MQHRGQLLNFLNSCVHHRLLGQMGEDDQFGLIMALGRGLLQHGVDADAKFGQHTSHIGQHARLIGHAQAAGLNIVDGQHGQVLDG